MKRIPAFCLALILVFCSAAAAEEPALILTDFDDFTLTTDTPLSYRGEKSDGMPLFAFSSVSAGNVAMYMVNATWSALPEPVSADSFSEMIRASETAIRAQYAANGQQLKTFTVADAEEREFWGFHALLCDAELLVNVNSTEVCLVQRTIQVTGFFGTYIFSISAWSSDLLDEATEALVRGLQWK